MQVHKGNISGSAEVHTDKPVSAKAAVGKPAIFVFTTAYVPFIGGAEIAVQEIAKRLNNEFRFFIFTARMRKDLPRQEERDGVFIRRVGFGISADKFFLPLLGLWVAFSLRRKEKPVLYWTVMMSYASGVAYLLNMLTLRRTPIVQTLQEGDPLEYLQHGRWGLVGFSWRAALRRASYVTAISSFLLDTARSFGYQGKGDVIPNGVDTEVFSRSHDAETRRTFRSAHGFFPDDRIIITVSRLVEKNAVDMIIRALVPLRKRAPSVKLWVLGSGDKKEMLKALSRELGVNEGIRWEGDVRYEDVPSYLYASDVFVRPSRSEGLGNAFLEAMAAELPVVGTMVGGIADFLEDGKTGLAVRVDDPEDIAKSIGKILFDPVLAATIAAGGKRMVGERYQWEGIAKRFQKLFLAVSEEYAKPAVLVATGIFPPDIGGPATYSKLLADRLPPYGFRVRVLSFGSVRRFPVGIRHAMYLWRLFLEGRDSDLIFAQDPVSVGFPAMVAARVLQKKFVLKIVGDYAWEQGIQRFGVSELLDDFLKKRYGFRVQVLRAVERWSAERAGRVIVPSEYLRGVVTSWGLPRGKVKVIYNGFDKSETVISREEARRVLALSGTVAVSVGRLVPWKGFEVLVRAVPEIRRHVPDFRLVIVGSGPDERRLKRVAHDLNVSGAIFFAGALAHDNLVRYLAGGDMFLLNTGYEGFSHSILEAMAAGIPIVTTSVGGNNEVLKNDENGILIPFDDLPALVNAVRRLSENRVLGKQLADSARGSLLRFSTETTLAETAAELHHILGKDSVPMGRPVGTNSVL